MENYSIFSKVYSSGWDEITFHKNSWNLQSSFKNTPTQVKYVNSSFELGRPIPIYSGYVFRLMKSNTKLTEEDFFYHEYLYFISPSPSLGEYTDEWEAVPSSLVFHRYMPDSEILTIFSELHQFEIEKLHNKELESQIETYEKDFEDF